MEIENYLRVEGCEERMRRRRDEGRSYCFAARAAEWRQQDCHNMAALQYYDSPTIWSSPQACPDAFVCCAFDRLRHRGWRGTQPVAIGCKSDFASILPLRIVEVLPIDCPYVVEGWIGYGTRFSCRRVATKCQADNHREENGAEAGGVIWGVFIVCSQLVLRN